MSECEECAELWEKAQTSCYDCIRQGVLRAVRDAAQPLLDATATLADDFYKKPRAKLLEFLTEEGE